MRLGRAAVTCGVLGVLSSAALRSVSAEPATAHGSTATPVAEASGSQPTQARPFGPGTEVEVVAPGARQVQVYVARAVDRRYRPLDREFVKVGKTPIVFELPAGQNFWLEVESRETTRGEILLRMARAPKHLQVRPGSSDMSDLGSLTLAVGASAVVAATAILISGTSAGGGLDKPKVVIPLFAVGGVLTGGGIALYFVSRTHVDDASEQSARLPLSRPRHGFAAHAAHAGLRFSF